MVVGRVGEYAIEYIDTSQTQDWPGQLPVSSWALLVLVGEADRVLFARVTEACMKRLPLAICCAGPGAHLLEDYFDEAIVDKALLWEQEHARPYDYEFAPVTMADTAIDEGFWYAVTLAPAMAHETGKTILCLDLTASHHARIVELIRLINNGWLPPDTDND